MGIINRTPKKLIGNKLSLYLLPNTSTILSAKLVGGRSYIILPLDLDKETKEKVTYALEYARYWDATIRVVSVLLSDNQEIKGKLNGELDILTFNDQGANQS